MRTGLQAQFQGLHPSQHQEAPDRVVDRLLQVPQVGLGLGSVDRGQTAAVQVRRGGPVCEDHQFRHDVLGTGGSVPEHDPDAFLLVDLDPDLAAFQVDRALVDTPLVEYVHRLVEDLKHFGEGLFDRAKQPVGFVVGKPRPVDDHRRRDPRIQELEVGRQREDETDGATALALEQSALALGECSGQHGDVPVGQIEGRHPFPGREIQDRIPGHEAGHVGDMHADPVTVRCPFR